MARSEVVSQDIQPWLLLKWCQGPLLEDPVFRRLERVFQRYRRVAFSTRVLYQKGFLLLRAFLGIPPRDYKWEIAGPFSEALNDALGELAQWRGVARRRKIALAQPSRGEISQIRQAVKRLRRLWDVCPRGLKSKRHRWLMLLSSIVYRKYWEERDGRHLTPETMYQMLSREGWNFTQRQVEQAWAALEEVSLV